MNKNKKEQLEKNIKELSDSIYEHTYENERDEVFEYVFLRLFEENFSKEMRNYYRKIGILENCKLNLYNQNKKKNGE